MHILVFQLYYILVNDGFIDHAPPVADRAFLLWKFFPPRGFFRGEERKNRGIIAELGGFMKNKIYITGHKNPDTDSIASAIALAELKN